MDAELVVALLLCAISGAVSRPPDWLVYNVTTEVTATKEGGVLTLTNGLISRVFTFSPAFATANFRSEVKDKSILRTVFPEAFVTLDGTQYPVGGLVMSGHHSYFNRSKTDFSVSTNTFNYVGYTTGTPVAPFHWESGIRHSPTSGSWPPKGLTLCIEFQAPSSVTRPEHVNVTVYVNYEMYVGIPLLAKWLTISYSGVTTVRVDSIIVEYLGVQKPYAPGSYVQLPAPWDHDTSAVTTSWLYVESSEPHGTLVSWGTDPVAPDSPGADEPTLNCTYSLGPGVILGNTSLWVRDRSQLKRDMGLKSQFAKADLEMNVPPRKTSTGDSEKYKFDTFHVLELVTDSSDQERVALSRHRMTRLLAPQTQENPIFFHGTDWRDQGFKTAIDQMAEVGFEMFIISFGSGFNLEDLSDENLHLVAANVQYANDKGIEVGGYDLIVLERGHGGYGGDVGAQWDAIDPNTLSRTENACFASGWYDKLRGIIYEFILRTGLSMLETDGPYGGSQCASETHTHHTDNLDSIFWQNKLQGQLYSDLRYLNVFINQPDGYFYQGGSKTGMGYNEVQYNLGRWEDLSVSRQGMFDDTYHFIPTQGWMFAPLIQYHGGGSPAEFEPLRDHLLQYEWALAQYLGYGVAACYRGPRLYDSVETMELVKKWVGFYNTYRDILISDIVHVRRPDMQDYDCILHVNPYIEHRGLAMVFNPTLFPSVHNLSLPLYYTGITDKALVFHEGQGEGTEYLLSRDYTITIPFSMTPQSITWYLIKSVD